VIWVFKALWEVMMTDSVKKAIASIVALAVLSGLNYLNVKFHIDDHSSTSMVAVRQILENAIMSELGGQP